MYIHRIVLYTTLTMNAVQSCPRMTESNIKNLHSLYGFEGFVQHLITKSLSNLRTIGSFEDHELSKQIAKDKARIYLTFLKRNKAECETLVNAFKAMASDNLSEIMDGNVGNVMVQHGNGTYFHKEIKMDEQSRQVAIALHNAIDVMNFLLRQI